MPAVACATCLDTAFGDRGFNAALLALMATPFVVAAVIGGVIAWAGVGRRSDDASKEGPRC
jgi:ethanolamine transporter EutH